MWSDMISEVSKTLKTIRRINDACDVDGTECINFPYPIYSFTNCLFFNSCYYI